MNLSISNIAWESSQNECVYALMQKYGFSGLEIAPTKIIANEPYFHITDAKEWANKILERYGFCISSMQSIWYGKTEKVFATKKERDTLFEYTKSAIDFASAIGCKNLVFGCPKNRNISKDMNFDEWERIAIDFFRQLGDYATAKNTCIGMEANPDIYGTNFVNTTGEAIALIEKVNSTGFKLNLDVGSMIQNSENISVLSGKTSLINHVHISEPFLKKIERRELHEELIKFLRDSNYKGFISIEMGMQNGIGDIADVLQYLRSFVK